MSDAFPPQPGDPAGDVPPSATPPSGAPGQPFGAPQQYGAPSGYVPPSMEEIWYKPGLNILLAIVTCGIWAIVWSYKTHDDLYKHNGDGINGVIALIIAIFASFVIMFTVPMELEKAYQRRGWQSPESPMLGLWFLLPIIGNFIWYLKIQRALNAYWVAVGSRPAAA